MKKRSKKLLLLALAIIASPAAAAVPYAKITGLQLAFDAMPAAQRDKLLLHIKIIHIDHADHTPIRLWVIDGTQRNELVLGPDSTLPDAPRQDWADRNLVAETDQKPHSVQTETDLAIRPPAGQLTTDYLRVAAQQAQQAITAAARRMGGYLATFAAPTVRGVTLTLAGCCTGAARLPGQVLTQDKAGEIIIPNAALAMSAPIALTAPITRIDPTAN